MSSEEQQQTLSKKDQDRIDKEKARIRAEKIANARKIAMQKQSTPVSTPSPVTVINEEDDTEMVSKELSKELCEDSYDIVEKKEAVTVTELVFDEEKVKQVCKDLYDKRLDDIEEWQEKLKKFAGFAQNWIEKEEEKREKSVITETTKDEIRREIEDKLRKEYEEKLAEKDRVHSEQLAKVNKKVVNFGAGPIATNSDEEYFNRVLDNNATQIDEILKLTKTLISQISSAHSMSNVRSMKSSLGSIKSSAEFIHKKLDIIITNDKKRH